MLRVNQIKFSQTSVNLRCATSALVGVIEGPKRKLSSHKNIIYTHRLNDQIPSSRRLSLSLSML